MTICTLSEKKCVPCQGGVPPLSHEVSENLLQQLNSAWVINERGYLQRIFDCENFVSAMELANKITVIAEEEAHHPDLTITYGSCKVEIYTHKINDLTESDFILAAKIDSM